MWCRFKSKIADFPGLDGLPSLRSSERRSEQRARPSEESPAFHVAHYPPSECVVCELYASSRHEEGIRAAAVCDIFTSDVNGNQTSPTAQTTRPGFRMPFGSSACLSARISAISVGLREIGSQDFFSSPMPCSAEIAPPTCCSGA